MRWGVGIPASVGAYPLIHAQSQLFTGPDPVALAIGRQVAATALNCGGVKSDMCRGNSVDADGVGGLERSVMMRCCEQGRAGRAVTGCLRWPMLQPKSRAFEVVGVLFLRLCFVGHTGGVMDLVGNGAGGSMVMVSPQL